jgi:hypothetical protein
LRNKICSRRLAGISQCWGELGVYPAGLCGGEVPGRGSDAAGLVSRHLPGQRGCPNLSESVPQVERVGDQPGR